MQNNYETLSRPRSLTKRALIFIVPIAVATLGVSQAAVVTTNEAAIEAIFTVGGSSIDLRFLPTTTVYVDPELASEVNTSTEFADIMATRGGADPSIIQMFFVDLLSTCGTRENDPSINHCAGQSIAMIESPLAAAGIGPELMARALGNNLLLGYTPDAVTGAPPGNLMDRELNGNTTLIAAQMARMLSDSKVQTDAGGRYIEIQPIIVASNVPEPSSLLLCGIGISGLLLRRRR